MNSVAKDASELTDRLITEGRVMEQAQVFASARSLVGGHDAG